MSPRPIQNPGTEDRRGTRETIFRPEDCSGRNHSLTVGGLPHESRRRQTV